MCLPNPCENEGVCTESLSPDGFACVCKDGWHGRSCGSKYFMSSWVILRIIFFSYVYNAKPYLTIWYLFLYYIFQSNVYNYKQWLKVSYVFFSEISFAFLFSVRKTPCSPNPCQHDGHCLTDGTTFQCICGNGLSGKLCEGILSTPSSCHPMSNLFLISGLFIFIFLFLSMER